MATLNSDLGREVQQVAAPAPRRTNSSTSCRSSSCCWNRGERAPPTAPGAGGEDGSRPRPDCSTLRRSPPRLTTTAAMARISPHRRRRRASTTWSRSGSPDLRLHQVRFYPLCSMSCVSARVCAALSVVPTPPSQYLYLSVVVF